jgi:chaperonin GroES
MDSNSMTVAVEPVVRFDHEKCQGQPTIGTTGVPVADFFARLREGGRTMEDACYRLGLSLEQGCDLLDLTVQQWQGSNRAPQAAQPMGQSESKVPVFLHPYGNRLVILQDDSEDKSRGGILLPDTAKKKPCKGMVMGVGPDVKHPARQGGPACGVYVGAVVMFERYSGHETKIGEQDYVVIEDSHLLGVLK